MDERQVVARQTQPSGSGSGSALPDPEVSLSEAITIISPCLALVRPIGMSDGAAEEWLSVAASELVGYSRWSVQSAAAHARKECSHHGQIIPAMMNHMESNYPHFDKRVMHRERELAIAQAKAPQIERNPEVTALIASAASSMKV